MRLPLSLRLYPSRTALGLLTAVHGLAVAAVAISQILLPFKIALLGIVAWSLTTNLRRHALRTAADAVTRLTLRDVEGFEIEYRDGRCAVARIEGSSTVTHWLMALHLRQEKRRLFVFLLPDMLDADAWRKLSVLLRTEALNDQPK